MRNNIDGAKQIIYKHTEAKDLSMREKNLKLEYKFFEKYIDREENHKKYSFPYNKEYDRYKDIKPYYFNFIGINNGNNHYINSSPINIFNDKYFIATQGPKKKTIDDFWTMIFENNCKVIVMLCNVIEEGKQKCENYWDLSEESNYQINKSEENKGKYIIRELEITSKPTNENRKVTQLHFIEWPDKGVTEVKDSKNFECFEEMIKYVESHRENNPVVVHCSAGVGRTGTFISMYCLYKEINKQIEDENENIIQFNVFNLVRKLKEMRKLSVQTFEQYQFIYKFTEYILKKYNK